MEFEGRITPVGLVQDVEEELTETVAFRISGEFGKPTGDGEEVALGGLDFRAPGLRTVFSTEEGALNGPGSGLGRRKALAESEGLGAMADLAGRFREGAIGQSGKILSEFANGVHVEREEVATNQGLGIVCGNVFRGSGG